MIKLINETYDESTNELVERFVEFEGEVISWGRTKTKYELFKSFKTSCGIAKKLVNDTINEQEMLDYWHKNYDRYQELHPGLGLRDSLHYYIRNIKLIDGDNVIEEQSFRYGM